MTTPKRGRPISVPQATRDRKLEIQTSIAWGVDAIALFKSALTENGMGFPELAEALSQKLGTEIDPKVLNRRVNRGNFSVGFLLMCLDALGLDVQIDRMDPAKAMRPKLPKLPNKPVNAVGSIMDAWGNK